MYLLYLYLEGLYLSLLICTLQRQVQYMFMKLGFPAFWSSFLIVTLQSFWRGAKIFVAEQFLFGQDISPGAYFSLIQARHQNRQDIL